MRRVKGKMEVIFFNFVILLEIDIILWKYEEGKINNSRDSGFVN